MTKVMVGAVLRRVVFNNRIEQAFNRCGVGRVPRSQADPLGVKEVLVMAPQLETMHVHTNDLINALITKFFDFFITIEGQRSEYLNAVLRW